MTSRKLTQYLISNQSWDPIPGLLIQLVKQAVPCMGAVCPGTTVLWSGVGVWEREVLAREKSAEM
jgi:hypothetical protein